MRGDDRRLQFLTVCAVVLLSLMGFALPGFAQAWSGTEGDKASLDLVDQSPLDTIAHVPPPRYMGIEFGIGRDFQFGSLGKEDPTAQTTGLGEGYMISVVGETGLNKLWSLGLHAGLRSQSITGVYESPQYDTKTAFISLWPQIEFGVRPGLFVALGPDFSILITSRIQSDNITPQTIPNSKNFNFGIVSSVGYDIDFGPFVVTPLASYDAMLTNLSSNSASGWEISTLYGAVAVKLKLN